MPSILLFFNISGGELAIVALIVFIILGPDKLPDIARKFGKAMRFIRKATDDIKREINIDEDLIKQARSYSVTNKTLPAQKKTDYEASSQAVKEKKEMSEDNKNDL